MKLHCILSLVGVLLWGCSHSITRNSEVSFYQDDLGSMSLTQALGPHIYALEKSPETVLRVGKIQFEKSLYLERLRTLQRFLETNHDKIVMNKMFRQLFDVVEVISDRETKEILLTSYYSPRIKGSLSKTSKYSFPILKKPQGELFSRADIAEKNPYADQKLELLYLDPIEAFFLHVQGSGMVELENGEIVNLVFDGSNGKPYVSIGKDLVAKNILEKEKVTLESLEVYLRSLSSEALAKTLNVNTSYIFFKFSDRKSITTLGTIAYAGRTIATDGGLFSKGLLGYLHFNKPILSNDSIEFVESSRFVLDQDTGSAIKGSGRVDLFWGDEVNAKSLAGTMKHPARLYYLIPKNL